MQLELKKFYHKIGKVFPSMQLLEFSTVRTLISTIFELTTLVNYTYNKFRFQSWWNTILWIVHLFHEMYWRTFDNKSNIIGEAIGIETSIVARTVGTISQPKCQERILFDKLLCVLLIKFVVMNGFSWWRLSTSHWSIIALNSLILVNKFSKSGMSFEVLAT